LNSHNALKLDPVTMRVIDLGWRKAQAFPFGAGKEK
jgi:hypothetical protein